MYENLNKCLKPKIIELFDILLLLLLLLFLINEIHTK